MSKRVRILALMLAVLVLCGTLAGALSIMVHAASNDIYNIVLEDFTRDSGIGAIKSGTTVNFSITYRERNTSFVESDKNQYATVNHNSITFGSGMKTSSSTQMRVSLVALDENDSGEQIASMRLDVTKAIYNGAPKNISITKTISNINIGSTPYELVGNSIDISIPNEFLESQSSSTVTEDDDNPYKSDIVVENIYFTDSSGERIDKVDSDSPSFNLVIIYADYGLVEVDADEFDDRSLDVYLTETGGFTMGAGTKGTISYLKDTSSDAPRFRAAFRNVTYDGGSNAVSFRVQYDVEGWIFSGTGAATANNAKDDDDDDELAPLTPHIIVNQYSYGTEQINAGDNFTLTMSVTNTSPDIPLENIVMTIQPYIPENNTSSTTGGLTITSASNTLYIPALGIGEVYTHSIDLRAEPSAAVGSHKVEVDFSFQYVDDVNTKRETATDQESIAIPVSQVDRFMVDPLTEIPDMMFAGQSEYLTLTFVNKGKSTTYNISGALTSNMSEIPQNVHFGNLEAGKADSMDFDLIANEPGEMIGEIQLLYEDENANQNEILIPFSIYVEEMYSPDMDFDGDMFDPDMEEPEGLNTATVVLCVIGGLLIAAPIALYLHKRVKAKGIEDLDEDI